jgi:uncharacterized protein YkwD
MSGKHSTLFTLCLALILAAGQCMQARTASAEEKYLEPVAIPIPAGALSANPGDEAKMAADVNAGRSAIGLPPLVVDPKLASVARAYARDMAARRYFGHRNPEGRSVSERFDFAGISYQYAGENIAFVQSEDEAMDGFLNSPDHKANMLSNRYTRIGVGVVSTDGYGALYVQEFSDGSEGQ